MEEFAGKIIHFFAKIGVAVVKLEAGLKTGDLIRVKGKKSDFEQKIESMQIDRKDVGGAAKGEEVAIKLNEAAKEGDEIYKKS